MNLRGKNKIGGTEASTEALAGAGALPNTAPVDDWDAAWEASTQDNEQQSAVIDPPEGEGDDGQQPSAGEAGQQAEPPPQAASAPPPAAPAPDPVAAALERLAQAQTTQTQAIGNMADQMRLVKAEAAVASTMPQTPGGPSQEQIVHASKDPESWAKFKEQWGAEWAQPIDELIDHRLQAALKAAGDPEKLKAEMRAEWQAERAKEKEAEEKAQKDQQVLNTAIAEARAEVLKARPTFDADRTSDAFQAWLNVQAPGIRELAGSYRPADALALMSIWDATKPVVPTADDVHARRERKLRQSTVSPGSVVSPPVNGGDPFAGLNYEQAWELDTKLKERASPARR